MWGCVVSAGREHGAGKIPLVSPPAPQRVEAWPAEAAFWLAPQLGADEPLQTLWDSGLLAYVDRGGQRLNVELARFWAALAALARTSH
jgi:hypothetical protein